MRRTVLRPRKLETDTLWVPVSNARRSNMVADVSVVGTFPYTAISVSIFARFIFLWLLYKNKSKNNYSLVFCLLNIGASSLWLVYSIFKDDTAMIYRSGTEISLLTISSLYIVRNKFRRDQVLPAPVEATATAPTTTEKLNDVAERV